MATLETNILGIEFENPFLLASAPPTALIESIDKAFELGWGGAASKFTTHNVLNKKYCLLPNINKLEYVLCGLSHEYCVSCSLFKHVCPRGAITMCI